MTAASAVALLAAFCAGVFFILASLLRRRDPVPVGDPVSALPAEPIAVPIIGAPPDIYWPIMLGTGERNVEPHLRRKIVRELGELNDAWSGAILLCALEQERDPQLVAAVRAALRQ